MKQIPLYKLLSYRYGEELLIDVLDYEDVKDGISITPVFSETFYSITLILDGETEMSVNGHFRRVHPGMLISSIPGEVWSIADVRKIKGLDLVFEKQFLLSFFNDQHFLDRFTYLQPDRPSPFMMPNKSMLKRIVILFNEMRREIVNYKVKDQHLLRAILYQILTLLNRLPLIEPEHIEVMQRSVTDIPASRYINDFVRLVSDHLHEEHGTEFYANHLFITPNYLNKIVKRTLGKSAKSYILEQVLHEACRLLQYTTLSVGEIAVQLHFDSQTYLTRLFRKYMGCTPLEYRNKK